MPSRESSGRARRRSRSRTERSRSRKRWRRDGVSRHGDGYRSREERSHSRDAGASSSRHRTRERATRGSCSRSRSPRVTRSLGGQKAVCKSTSRRSPSSGSMRTKDKSCDEFEPRSSSMSSYGNFVNSLKQQRENIAKSILGDDFQCSICLELFVLPTSLHCGHTFCKRCIAQYTRTKSKCPTCRRDIRGKLPDKNIHLNRAVECIVDQLDQEGRRIYRERSDKAKSEEAMETQNYDADIVSQVPLAAVDIIARETGFTVYRGTDQNKTILKKGRTCVIIHLPHSTVQVQGRPDPPCLRNCNFATLKLLLRRFQQEDSSGNVPAYLRNSVASNDARRIIDARRILGPYLER